MNLAKKILIADDEPDILEILKFNLEAEGYEVYCAKNGVDAVALAKKHHPHLIILDVMMPAMNGIDACAQLRNLPEFRDTLIVFLSALGDESAELNGLGVGADDYMTKPIGSKVLKSKVQSLFRRLENSPKSSENDDAIAKLQLGSITIDRDSFLVFIEDKEVALAKKEFELLSLLASRPGKVFLRDEILNKVWGSEVIVGDRTIDVHIRKIRQKMNLDCIATIKGVGYKFVITEE